MASPSNPRPSLTPFSSFSSSSPPLLCIGLILTLFACNSTSQGQKTTTTPNPTTSVSTTTISPNSSTNSSTQLQLKYTILMALNVVCIFFQLYASIFGRRMRMNGVRWFTLYYTLWNIYQLVVVSNTADNSPLRGWLNDPLMIANKASLELLTMTIFPLGTILLVPLLLLSHFCFCCPFRWLPWIPLFLLLSLLSLFIYNGGLNFSFPPVVAGNATLSLGNGTSASVLQTFSFTCICLSLASVFYLLPLVFVALFFFLCYRLFNRFNPKSNHSLRFSRVVDLVLLFPFLLVVLLFHLPCYVANLSGFFLENIFPSISPYVLPYLSGGPVAAGGNSTSSAGAGAGGVDWIKKILDTYNEIVQYKELTEMMIPLVEFLASLLFIRMYREQYFALFSCYACYRDDKDGACCSCCGLWRTKKQKLQITPVPVPILAQPMMIPQNPNLWAQPVIKV